MWKSRLFKAPKGCCRFLLPLLVIFLAKFFGGLILYYTLNMGLSDTYWMTVNWDPNGQNAILKSGTTQGIRWPYLFLGWDSAWYLGIVAKGYAFSDQSYSFFPGLPLSSWLLNLILQNSFYSLVIFSLISGMLWVPIYQLVAERFMDQSKAIESTLFYAFFPVIFLFTTVAYSEGLFLSSTMGAWYFLKKKRILVAMFFASIATISRPPGLLIVLPIMFEIGQIHARRDILLRHRDIVYFSFPFMALFAWLLYCKVTLNDWFAPLDRSAWNSMYSFSVLISNVLANRGIEAPSEKSFRDFWTWPASLAWIVFLLFPPFLIYALRKMDKSLAFYSVIYFLGILAFGALGSIPRFVSFLFPIWLPLTARLFQRKHSGLFTLTICASFYLTGLILWYGFISGVFVS